jgi:hypothetical protein
VVKKDFSINELGAAQATGAPLDGGGVVFVGGFQTLDSVAEENWVVIR